MIIDRLVLVGPGAVAVAVARSLGHNNVAAARVLWGHLVYKTDMRDPIWYGYIRG